MSRTILIGDLHGCFHEAIKLLDKCAVTSADRVVMLGDLVDRGPDSAACVELAMRLERDQGSPACILGNHEEKHLMYRAKEERGGVPSVNSPHHAFTRTQLTSDHYAYLKQLPLFIRLPEHNAIAVHAGIYPYVEHGSDYCTACAACEPVGHVPIEEQTAAHLLHIQNIDPRRTSTKSTWPSKSPHDWVFWTNLYRGPEHIIFGHTVVDKPLRTKYATGIDGGACFGRDLHALILPDWEIVTVHGPGENPDKRGNPPLPRRVNKYPIHGDVSAYS